MPWILHIHTSITAENCLWRYPGIPEIKLFGLLEYALGATTFNFARVPQVHPEIIGSVRIGSHDVKETTSDTELFLTPGAYYYDYAAGALRLNIAKYDNDVAVEGHQSPIGQRIAIGIIVGVCDAVDYTREDKSTYSGIFHDPRFKSLPTLSAKMDDLDYGFQAFHDWTIPLIGVDGEFEGTDHTGCITKLMWLPEGGELSSGKTVASGRTQKTTDGDDYSISIGDIRRNFENTASCGRFSKDDFPYLDDEDVGKIIPMYWNKQTGVEPICLNKTEDLSDSYSSVFRYCIGATPDTAHAYKRIDRVYTEGADGSMEIKPGFGFGVSIQTGLRRADKLSPTLSACAAPRVVIASGWSYETQIPISISAADVVSVTASQDGVLTSGTDYTLSGTTITLHDSETLENTAQTIIIDGKTVDIEVGRDYTVATDADGYALISFISGGAISSNDRAVTVSASSDDNNGEDIEAPVSAWTATLHDPGLGMAYISVPASVALANGDSPIDIKVDLFAWHNQTPGENEWMNGADIIRDAIELLAGYSYDSNHFDVQSWEVERVKCADKGIHVSPRIEDDTAISDLLSKVSKSCLMLVTSRPEGCFDLKVDSMDVYPQWKIESYQRMETPSPSLDLSQAFSSIKIEYGTSGDNDKKTYLDTTYEKDIKAINAISKVKSIDTIISDEESAKQYAAMVYERVFDLATMKMRDLIEIKVPAETYLINICPSKAFIAPRTREGSLFAAYTVLSASRALGDDLITVTGRKRYNIEYDTEYTQGVLCDDFICDAAVIGATTIEAA